MTNFELFLSIVVALWIVIGVGLFATVCYYKAMSLIYEAKIKRAEQRIINRRNKL